MPIASVEGLALTLLLLVPGGLGVELRRWIFPAKEPSPFAELLHALAASGTALIVLEAGAAIYGWVTAWPGGMGDALLRPLADAGGIPASGDVWAAYVSGFLPSALALPSIAGAARRAGWARRVFGRIALYEFGPDQLFREIWRPPEPRLAPWVVVQTSDGRSIRGQLIWRTTAPNPLEVLLMEVVDVTHPDRPASGEGAVLWIPRENIRRIWLLATEGSLSS